MAHIALTILAGFILWQTMGWTLYASSCPVCGTKSGEHGRDCPNKRD